MSQRIGDKYELLEPIGEGGMGIVYRARQEALGRDVAIKRVHADRASPAMLERFLREARSSAKVRAPNVVEVLDFGTDSGGDPFLVMELLHGESLEARLARHPKPTTEETLDWADQALAGLMAIHEAGIVHRDLKPANLFLARGAQTHELVVKVLDFGIARPADADVNPLTHTMQTLGTPHYMSPEQVRSARSVDARSDVYAMGVILYLALTGKLPFDGPSATAVVAAIVTDDPAPIVELAPSVPRAIARVVESAMARAPRDRYASAGALRHALARARQGQFVAPEASDGSALLKRAFEATERVSSERITPSAGASATEREVVPPTHMERPLSRRRAWLGAGMAVALMSAGGAFFAATREAPRPPRPVRASTIVTSNGLSRVETEAALPALALVWRALPTRDRARVRLERRAASRYALLVETPGLAQRLAESIGGRVEAAVAVADDTILEPVLLHTTARVNVRQAPTQESALLGTVPKDSVVVGLRGTFDGAPSGAEGTQGWLRVFASRALEGWMARRLLELEDRCVPALGILEPDEIAARSPLHLEAPVDAWLFVGQRRVRVFATSRECGLDPRGVFEVEGAIADLFVTSRERDGASILVLGTWPEGHETADGRMRWSAFAMHPPGPAFWHIDLHSGQNLPDRRREGLGGPFGRDARGVDGFFPLRVRGLGTRRFFVWSEAEGTFQEVVSEAAPSGAAEPQGAPADPAPGE